jgi:hypothetical protein
MCGNMRETERKNMETSQNSNGRKAYVDWMRPEVRATLRELAKLDDVTMSVYLERLVEKEAARRIRRPARAIVGADHG